MGEAPNLNLHTNIQGSGKVPARSQRKKCKNCLNPLKIVIDRVRDRRTLSESLNDLQKKDKGDKTAIGWHYESYGHFCSIRCGCQFANNLLDRK